jgi:hypothetical protein
MTGFSSTWEAGIIIEYLSFTYPLFFLKLSSYWNWTALVGTWSLTFKLLQLDITSSWEPLQVTGTGQYWLELGTYYLSSYSNWITLVENLASYSNWITLVENLASYWNWTTTGWKLELCFPVTGTEQH